MRRNQLPYISEWMGFWANLSNRTADKWSVVAKEAKQRQYTQDKLLSDVIDFWTGTTISWWEALAGPKVDTVYFQLTQETNCDCSKSIPVYLPSCPTVSDAQKVWMGRIDDRHTKPPAGSLITEDMLRVRLNKDDSIVELHLVDLPPAPREPATYQALVRLGEEVVGIVYINVLGPPSPPARGRQRARKKISPQRH